jgi:VanZ family protein
MKVGNFLKFISYFAPLLFWMLVIFYFSSQEGSTQQYYDPRMFIERKGAHVVEYAILVVFIIRALRYLKTSTSKIGFYAALGAFLYAVSDEFHQVFVYGREGKFFDVGVDLIGIISASVIYHYVLHLKSKKIK